MAEGDNSFYRRCFILWLHMSLFHCASAAVIGGSSSKETYDSQSALECDKGQHILFNLDKDTCIPCPVNTFMYLANHRQPRCFPCASDPVYPEVILHPCTRTSDTVLDCAGGHFIEVTSFHTAQIQCAKCHNCSDDYPPRFERRPCEGHDDTVCCPKPRMKVVPGDSPRDFHCINL